MQSLSQRFLAACRNLYDDCGMRGFNTGSNLVGIIDLPNGKAAQIHVTMVTDEYEFIDSDEPTGCADDLACNQFDFREQQ